MKKEVTETTISEQIEHYLQHHNGIPIPSLEGFCLQYDYDIVDILLSGDAVQRAIRKLRLLAIVTLEKFLLLDVSMITFSDKKEGKTYKLDKRGIVYQLDYLRALMKE